KGASDEDMAKVEADILRAERRSMVLSIVRAGVPVALGILVFILALVVIGTIRRQPDIRSGRVAEKRVDEVLPEEAPPKELVRARAEEQKRAEVKQSLDNLAKSKPDEVAALIQGWMAEE
ncbi:MAG: hypothetical protein NUW23_06305, partial [Firmicutes bacterium]|nr:hypothetical protein [Bacillota bacterium]